MTTLILAFAAGAVLAVAALFFYIIALAHGMCR